MGDLDQELSEALEESEQDSSSEAAQTAIDAPAVSVNPEREEREGRGRNLGLLAALLIAGAGVLTLVFTSVDDAAIYSVTTDVLLDQKEKYEDRNVKVEGDLVPGTLTYRKEPCEYRFDMERSGKKLSVRFPECVVPDTVKDVPGVPVQITAAGQLNPDGHFDATQIMAKCPSKYEMQNRAAKGEEAPHAVMGSAPPPPSSQE
jgi:cytochrome c-type biogenesis protein CcmE